MKFVSNHQRVCAVSVICQRFSYNENVNLIFHLSVTTGDYAEQSKAQFPMPERGFAFFVANSAS